MIKSFLINNIKDEYAPDSALFDESDTLAYPFENRSVDKKIILGDIAMCAGKINTDSIFFRKEKLERWAHLTIHSTLHLLGYSHDNKIDQENMENTEIDILKKFNIFNPYEI